jgi:uroporphyrinogen III methyltransferase/synthase
VALTRGKVYLVGAGPGDPKLVTVKGLECIKGADVIVYDRLVDDRLLAEARPDAEMVYVGKTSRRHTMKQSEINKLLVRKAGEGKAVVRLKGGDPFVLGRGGEEAEELADRGIPFEVVPGVSAAMAVPAYAGIPVTHRGLASSLGVITGHEDPTKGDSAIAWDKVAAGMDTLVFLMGVENLAEIIGQLVKKGRPPATPVALIQNGTGPRQRTIVGTLADIADRAKEADFSPPAVIVVGEVVGLRPKLRWFDTRPLFGKRVLVTRARSQASVLSQMLADEGAEVIEMPAIEIEPVTDWRELDRAISGLSGYQWVIFTSVNAVEAFMGRLHAHNLDARALGGVRICAIGPATAAALKAHGLEADWLPQEYTAEGIIAGFKDRAISGGRVLLPRVQMAPQGLVEGLSGLGAAVEQVAAYRTVPATEALSRGKKVLLDGEVDIVTFTSSSTVRNLVSALGTDWPRLNEATIACIGPVTAATAAELGLKVDIAAREHTIPGLVAAIVEGLDKPQEGARYG